MYGGLGLSTPLLSDLFDVQAFGGKGTEQVGLRPGQIEPGQPIRAVEDNHMPIVDRRDVRAWLSRK
jgi:hypothetical protein